jgi:hypothetical protein
MTLFLSLHDSKDVETQYSGYERRPVTVTGGTSSGGVVVGDIGGVYFGTCLDQFEWEIARFKIWRDGEPFASGAIKTPMTITQNITPHFPEGVTLTPDKDA